MSSKPPQLLSEDYGMGLVHLSDAHDQIMIEFCSIIVCSITSIIGVPRSRS